MAFRIREITIHLAAENPANAPCMPASPEVQCPGGVTCRPTNVEPCKDKSKKPHPQGDPPGGGGGKKRSLDLLRAQLREVMVTL